MSTNISLSIIKELTKFRLTLSVVFSSFISYFLGASEVNLIQLFYLIAGGILIVSSSNIFNQIIERDLDKLMKRTQNRPLPKKEITPKLALFLAILSALIGLIFMYLINLKVAILAAVSIFLYTAIYTPMKLISPLSVFVGAIPGAFPFMIGWVAATNDIGIEALTLFLMQFFWQFPHFWALGWMLDDDYKKAGFNMLPTGKRDKKTAIQIILYIIWMIIISIFPYSGLTGTLSLSIYGAIIVLVLGILMLMFAVNLYNRMNTESARRLFLFTIFYLTSIQLVYIIDKFI